MKKNTNGVFFFLLLFITHTLLGQTESEKKQITKEYDIIKLAKLEQKFKARFSSDKAKALKLAKQKGWPTTFSDANGSYHELVKVSEEGKPIYYKTDNLNAAKSTRADWLHQGGGLNLNIEGQGMTAYVWDGGLARSTHQEYDGAGGDNRYSAGDGTTALNFHGAHVTGTIIASGVNVNAKGMAPQAQAIGHDWNSDLSEATTAAANGMLLSNHSYGFNANNIPDYYFGAYIQASRDWDELMYNAPYYLMVNSAGNDGNNNTANGAPLNGNASFDKLSGRKTGKNSLVVANGLDAVINADGTLNSVSRNTGSSEGPTDDLRIKPDIMGNGSGVFSTYENADDAYNSISGTSMASPNVMGSLLLLQQYYNSITGTFMRAATLKGLALHTADDAVFEGPDPQSGWGLMNTKVAAETITKNGLESLISEEVLNQGESFSITVKSDGTNPLLASISWTDPPGQVNTGTVNDVTPVLVNDLDIRVTNSTDTFEPWRLITVDAANKGDNNVDPFERVDVENATGQYTITVTHKGNLSGGSQRFSLIVTGTLSDFTLQPTNSEETTCTETSATFNFNYNQIQAGTTNFSTQGVPNGATVNFSTTSLSAPGNFSVTFGNLNNVAAGDYDIDIIGDNGNEVEKRTVKLIVHQASFANNPQNGGFPLDGERGISFSKVFLSWEKNPNAGSYEVEVSKSPSFNTLVASGIENGLRFGVEGLENETVYYWRVKPMNECGVGDFSDVFSFQTGFEDCSNTYAATDFTDAEIVTFSANTEGSVPIVIPNDLTINRLIVTADVSHTDVSDTTVLLQQPEELGGESIVLLTNPCNANDTDYTNAVFDDTAANLVCATAAPAITGPIKPEESLASSGGSNAKGTWFFTVTDNELFGGGQIDAASITVCTSEANTSLPTFTNNGLTVIENTTYIIQSSDLLATTGSETSAEQVYTLVKLAEFGDITKETVVLSIGDTFTQEDIDTGKIAFVNTESNPFVDGFRVNIGNSANGWLPNQRIYVNQSGLNVDQFGIKNLAVWPNPTNDLLNIRLEADTSDKVRIKLFDLRGRVIFNQSYNQDKAIFEESIHIGNFASGVYLLNVEQGNKQTTKRVLISD